MSGPEMSFSRQTHLDWLRDHAHLPRWTSGIDHVCDVAQERGRDLRGHSLVELRALVRAPHVAAQALGTVEALARKTGRPAEYVLQQLRRRAPTEWQRYASIEALRASARPYRNDHARRLVAAIDDEARGHFSVWVGGPEFVWETARGEGYWPAGGVECPSAPDAYSGAMASAHAADYSGASWLGQSDRSHQRRVAAMTWPIGFALALDRSEIF
jgi:hypothetical protein